MSVTEPQVDGVHVRPAPIFVAPHPTPGWLRVPGSLVQVSAGALDQVWGVSAGNDVFSFHG